MLAQLALYAEIPCMLISEPTGMLIYVFRTAIIANILAKVGLIPSPNLL